MLRFLWPEQQHWHALVSRRQNLGWETDKKIGQMRGGKHMTFYDYLSFTQPKIFLAGAFRYDTWGEMIQFENTFSTTKHLCLQFWCWKSIFLGETAHGSLGNSPMFLLTSSKFSSELMGGTNISHGQKNPMVNQTAMDRNLWLHQIRLPWSLKIWCIRHVIVWWCFLHIDNRHVSVIYDIYDIYLRNVHLASLALSKTGWWFQIFFIFNPIWGRFPFWLIFFKWVGLTTN